MKNIIYILLLFILTGCIRSDITINYQDINDPNLVINILGANDILANNDLEPIKNQLESNNWLINDINQSINGTIYNGYELIAPQSINKQLLLLVKENNDKITVSISRNTFSEILNISELKDLENFDSNSLSGIEVNLSIVMPEKIINSSVGKINKNEVSIDLIDYLATDKEINIISEKKNNNFSFINIIFFVVLAIILIILIRKKDNH